MTKAQTSFGHRCPRLLNRVRFEMRSLVIFSATRDVDKWRRQPDHPQYHSASQRPVDPPANEKGGSPPVIGKEHSL
jgi:hypothetical protein